MSELKAQWAKWTLVQLKAALTSRGCSSDGKKAELLERLAEYEAKKEAEQSIITKKPYMHYGNFLVC